MGLLDDKPRIDAKTFQEPLGRLVETIAQKVKREGHASLSGPSYIAEDLFVLIRQASATYGLMFYLNADERRTGDHYWFYRYGVVASQTVRSMIDIFYNVTVILQNPREMGRAYRKSGFRKALQDIDDDEQQYGGKPDWDLYLQKRRELTNFFVRMSGIPEAEVTTATPWLTLGRYVNSSPSTPHKEFLKKFTLLEWRQYSALSHAAFEAYMGEIPASTFFVEDAIPHDQRPKVDDMYMAFLTKHLGRAATVLLCLVTEIQAYFRFEGADIDSRITKIWAALMGNSAFRSVMGIVGSRRIAPLL
jgi:hypothetical protein